MWIENISIGDELLRGQTINTNTTYISKALLEEGYPTSIQVTLPDSPILLEQEIAKSLQRSDIVITTGGLGPTLDDLSKQVVSRVFNQELVVNPVIEKNLKVRFNIDPQIRKELAKTPKGSSFFINKIGSAPGLIFEKEKKVLIMLPGVPIEMQEMLKQVLPWLKQKFPVTKKTSFKYLNFCLLQEMDIDPFLRQWQSENLVLGIYPFSGLVRVSMGAQTKNSLEKLKALENTLTQKFKNYIYPSESGLIEEAIHKILLKRKETLILSESYSKGILAQKFLKQSNASSYFLGSFVASSDFMSRNIFSLPSTKNSSEKSSIKKEVEKLLEKLLSLSGATYAVVVSQDFNSLQGSEEGSDRFVVIGIQKKDQIADTGFLLLRKSQEFASEKSINIILSALWRKISQELPTLALSKFFEI